MNAIIQTILTILGLTTPTTDSALKAIQKSVAKLEKVSAVHTRKAVKADDRTHREILAHRRRIEKQKAVANAASVEADRARRVAAKLNDLVA
jgi:hypothetical protein